MLFTVMAYRFLDELLRGFIAWRYAWLGLSVFSFRPSFRSSCLVNRACMT